MQLKSNRVRPYYSQHQRKPEFCGERWVVVEFCILGPLLVRDDDGAERIVGGARQQVLLAALLVRAGHVVSTDTLAGYLWDGDPTPSARATVQSYVMRLRRQLGPAA